MRCVALAVLQLAPAVRAAVHEAHIAVMREFLDQYSARQETVRAEIGASQIEGISAADLEALRALGYLK